MKDCYVYITSNVSRTLYVGMTNDLQRRVCQHRQKIVPGFTSRYSLTLLVHFEVTSDVHAALAREKQIKEPALSGAKGWLRAKKVALIESVNPQWLDLSAEWA